MTLANPCAKFKPHAPEKSSNHQPTTQIPRTLVVSQEILDAHSADLLARGFRYESGIARALGVKPTKAAPGSTDEGGRS